MSSEDIIQAAVSIIISIGIFLVLRAVIKDKLRKMPEVQKLMGLISIFIVVIEGVYLGFIFGVFSLVAEVIASMGLAFALVTFALFNHLKNIVSGIGLHLNPEINVGDNIQVGTTKGKILEIGMLKTIAIADDGRKIFIPNLKFSEEVTILGESK